MKKILLNQGNLALSDTETADKAVAYCRVSTLKSEQELSLENQKKFFTDYISKRGDVLVGIYGESKSATKMQNRVELQKLFADAKAGKFHRVYIKDISRAFRNLYDFISVYRELTDCGVVLHLLGLGDGGRDVDEFTLNLLAMIAEQESRKMSERVKFGKELGRAEGVVPNFVFGYNKIDRTTLEINPDEAYWVRRIFDLYTEHGWGQCRIAEELRRNRIPTKKKKNGEVNYVWSTTTVGHILKHEIYTGKLASGKQRMKNLYTFEREEVPEENWVVHERPELRIISDEQFEKAQRMIAAAGKKLGENMKKGRSSTAHLFSNLIKCGSCGFSYRRWTRKPSPKNRYKNEYSWWTCSHRAVYGKDSCASEHIRIDEDWLIARLSNLFDYIVDNKTDFFESIEKKCSYYVKKYTEEQACIDLDALKSEEKQLTEERDRIKDMARRGMVDMDEAEKDMAVVNEKLKRIRITLTAADKTAELSKNVKSSIQKFIREFSAIDFTRGLDNYQLKKIIREIRVMSRDEIYVYFNVGGGDDGIDIPISLTDSVIFNTECQHGT